MRNEENDISLKNVLSLAYLGDSVFSLMVREYLINNHDLKPSGLNKIANSVVCAKTQAEILDQIKPELNQAELDVITRARNNCSHTKAKNSSVEEYNKATQLESLFGFWWLNKNKKMYEMFKKYVEVKL